MIPTCRILYRLWHLTLLSGILSYSAFGTTLVALRTPEAVYLAIDSRILEIQRGQQATGTGCKVTQLGPTLFMALAGLFQDDSFSAVKLAMDARANNDSMKKIADAFAVSARAPFQAFIRRLQVQQPGYFKDHGIGANILGVAFVGIESGVPTLSVRHFGSALVRDGSIAATPPGHLDCPGDCPTGITDIVLGESEAANAILNRTPQFWRDFGIVPGLNKLINAEIDRTHHTAVEGPIALLQVGSSSATWINPGLCQGVAPNVKADAGADHPYQKRDTLPPLAGTGVSVSVHSSWGLLVVCSVFVAIIVGVRGFWKRYQ